MSLTGYILVKIAIRAIYDSVRRIDANLSDEDRLTMFCSILFEEIVQEASKVLSGTDQRVP